MTGKISSVFPEERQKDLKDNLRYAWHRMMKTLRSASIARNTRLKKALSQLLPEGEKRSGQSCKSCLKVFGSMLHAPSSLLISPVSSFLGTVSRNLVLRPKKAPQGRCMKSEQAEFIRLTAHYVHDTDIMYIKAEEVYGCTRTNICVLTRKRSTK